MVMTIEKKQLQAKLNLYHYIVKRFKLTMMQTMELIELVDAIV